MTGDGVSPPAPGRTGARGVAHARSRSRHPGLLLGAVIAVVALNLRPALASIGPVLPEIRDGLGLSTFHVASMGSLGVLCLGVLAPAAPWAVRRWGLDLVLGAALACLFTGLVLRTTGGLALLYGGTALACGAIAVANVVVPALVKRDLSSGSGTILGVYTIALSGSSALAAGVTAPVAQMLDVGWRGALAMWALPALAALLLWLPRLRRRQAAVLPAAQGHLWRDRRAWQVTVFFAMLSVSFYTLLVWLPSLLRDEGLTPSRAGALLSVSLLAQAPAALIMPRLAAASAHQSRHAVLTTTVGAAGLVGLLVAPTGMTVLWMVLIGLGQGGAVSLAFSLILLRTRSSAETAQLSAMVQAVGFLTAAAGPLALGAVHEVTGSWTPGVVLLLLVMVLQMGSGAAAGRPGHVMHAPETPGRPGAPRGTTTSNR